MKLTMEFQRETDGRWTMLVPRWKLSFTRDTLDQCATGAWEWIAMRLKAGGLGKVERGLEEAILSMRLRGRTEDPWAGVEVKGVGKYLEITDVLDAIQWTGKNAPEVARLVSMTNGHTCFPVNERWLILENDKSRNGVDLTDWVVRRSDSVIVIVKDEIFRNGIVPLPDVPKPKEGKKP